MTRAPSVRNLWWLTLALSLAACSSSSSGASGASASSASTAKATAPSVPAGVDAAVVRKACAAQCSNDFTSITVYRDGSGTVRRYERESNPGTCSHAPTLFFDEQGAESGVIPMVPIVPGSQEARRFEAIREQQTGGLRKAESMMCSNLASP